VSSADVGGADVVGHLATSFVSFTCSCA
jgi:hypothetical protein